MAAFAGLCARCCKAKVCKHDVGVLVVGFRFADEDVLRLDISVNDRLEIGPSAISTVVVCMDKG